MRAKLFSYQYKAKGVEEYPHLQSLNPRQMEAIQHKEGPILILAGAGSGKTRVLTNRVAHLVLAHKVPPDRILAVTFTNKATEEMQKRLWSMLGQKAEDLWVSTFHSAALRILRRHHRELNFTANFSVYDEQDSRALMKSVLKELGLDPKKSAPQAFLAKIDFLKSNYILPEEFKKDATSREQRDAVVYEEYQKALYRADAMDFGDLLVHAVTLFRNRPALLESYRRRLEYILVDEYQDTNHVQYLLLTLLGKPRNNVLVVGDDDQSIYSFRGADIRNILDFEKDFPGAKVVRLEENYRSTSVILGAANALISQNTRRKGKELWTAKEGGDLIKVFSGYDEADEARYVCNQIRDELNAGASCRDIAIFYRTNAQSRALEECLINCRLPYRIFGGLKFYERKEIKDILAYLRLLVNESDSQSFLRIVNTPVRGIGPKTVETIVNTAAEHGISLLAAAKRLALRHKGLNSFVLLMDSLKAAAMESAVGDLIWTIIEKTEYMKSLKEMKDSASESRIENLKELRGIGIRMASEAGEPAEALKAFLDRVALTSASENPDVAGVDKNEFVSLMTLHIAKGLEYPVVFLTGMEEGLLPHFRSLPDPASLEEERRLCYVGITRARSKLYLTRAQTRGMFAGDDDSGSTGFYRFASRFLTEVSDEYLDEESGGFDQMSEHDCELRFGDEMDNDAPRFTETKRKTPALKPARHPKNRTYASVDVPKNLSSGTRVSHPTFGMGIVDRVEGDPEDERSNAIITVQFDDFEEPMKLVHRFSRLSLAE